jgi:oligopeptide/dipeptide ABC transporter ATP-binding protein
MDNVLEIENLHVSFALGRRRVEAVSGVSISIPPQKVVCVVGESGCGKTVTALSVLRLIPDPPGRIDRGRITFGGMDLLSLPERELRKIRGDRISMIFQEPLSSLNPVFTVGDQIGEALRAHRKISRSKEKERVAELLELVRIPDPYETASRYPHQLSGGMCQRVMIAMALACEPQLLIADEPTTALDVTIQAGILELLTELKERLGMSILLITHDLGIVAQVADEVYVMYAGRVVEHAPAAQLFSSPRHPYTLGLLNSIPSTETRRKNRLKAIAGFVPPMSELPEGCRFQDRCPMVVDVCRSLDPPLVEVDKLHHSACFRASEVIR